MTALAHYERLESIGLWREDETAQRREVIVSFGSASLVLSDSTGTPLAHWSMAAVRTLTQTDERTIFGLDRSGVETLEVHDAAMVDAIGRVRAALRRQSPHPGRLRLILVAVMLIAAVLAAVFWLPTYAINYAARVVPAEKQREIGADLLAHTTKMTGPPCSAPAGQDGLRALEDWLLPIGQNLYVADLGDRATSHLPGGIVLIHRRLIEDEPGPEVAAGHILAERARMDSMPPMRALLRQAGTSDTLGFLATGGIRESTLIAFSQAQMTFAPETPDPVTLLSLFDQVGLSSKAYGQSLPANVPDRSFFIEQDPVQVGYRPRISDAQWIALQTICGSE